MIFALKVRTKFGDFPASHNSWLEGHHTLVGSISSVLSSGVDKPTCTPVFVGSTSIFCELTPPLFRSTTIDWPWFHYIHISHQLNPITAVSHVFTAYILPGAALQPPSQGSLLGFRGEAAPHAARHAAARYAPRRKGEAVHGDGADVTTLATGKGDWSEGGVPLRNR